MEMVSFVEDGARIPVADASSTDEGYESCVVFIASAVTHCGLFRTAASEE